MSLNALERLMAAKGLKGFTDVVKPNYVWYRHCDMIREILECIASGELTRVLITMPPRHGKTELASRLFTAHYLRRHPSRWVGLCSYSAELASAISRTARENFVLSGGELKPDVQSVGHWEIQGGGGFWSAGVGGSIVGKGFHLGVIDDPIKNAEEAASPGARQRLQDWYQSAFYSRAEPGAAILIISTRWHERDLTGWLLAEEDDSDHPERWTCLHLPAIAEAEPPNFPKTVDVAPDWRQPGEALCPERYPLDQLVALRAKNSYFFSALYQGRPTPPEGGMLKRQWFPLIQAAPGECDRVRYWDLAATAEGGDYTVGVLVSRNEGIFTVEDVVRGQWSPGERDRIMLQTSEADKAIYGYRYTIGFEEEPAAAGKAQTAAFYRLLAGFSLTPIRPSGDKALRAMPFASQAEAGNVRLVAGSWVRAYLEQLTAFPHGAYDDQVDATSGAFNLLAGKALPWWQDKELAEYLTRKRGPVPAAKESLDEAIHTSAA